MKIETKLVKKINKVRDIRIMKKVAIVIHHLNLSCHYQEQLKRKL